MTLKDYRKKRDFSETPEPSGDQTEGEKLRFVVQEHKSGHHHFDLRLEHGGVLVSWAVPKGLPESSGERRLAVQTEDHPLEYAGFEGTIPEGNYGAGEVRIWDRGLYEPLVWEKDKIEVILHGSRLTGKYVLVRFKKAGEQEWLIFRAKDG